MDSIIDLDSPFFQSARLYTASFMRVLLRSGIPFLSSWGIEMLVMQLYDQSKPVAMEALSVLSEACEEEVNYLVPPLRVFTIIGYPTPIMILQSYLCSTVVLFHLYYMCMYGENSDCITIGKK